MRPDKKFIFLSLILITAVILLVLPYLPVNSPDHKKKYGELEPMDSHLLFAFVTPHPPLIVPEIGGTYRLKARKTINALSYIAKQVKKAEPDTIIIITPHLVTAPEKFSVFKQESITGNLSEYGKSDVELSIDNDTEFISELENNLKNTGLGLKGINSEKKLDHGSFVPMYFFNEAGYTGKYVVINYSGLSREKHIQLGKIIRKTIEVSDKKFVFTASADLSHSLSKTAPNGYKPESAAFDRKIVNSIKAGNYKAIINMGETLVSETPQCGYNSILIGIGIMNMQPGQNKVFSYESPFGVGYMAASL